MLELKAQFPHHEMNKQPTLENFTQNELQAFRKPGVKIPNRSALRT